MEKKIDKRTKEYRDSMKSQRSITIKNGEGKTLFYTAINPNQEIIQSGVIYNNTSAYVQDNAYPNEILDTYKNGSSVFSRYVALKKNLIIGQGLVPIDPNDNALWDWIATENAGGMDKNDILECLAFDLSLYEGGYLQLVYNSLGEPVDLYFTDFNKIRAEEKNDLGFSQNYFYSDNWGIVVNQRQYAKAGVRNQAQFKLQAYNPNRVEEGDGRQIMKIMQYNGGSTYPTVSYNSVLPYIKLAYQLGVYELNRALQGFLPTTIVYVVGISGEEAQEEYVSNFENNFVGVNKSKVLFMFGETTDASPKIEKIDTNESEGVMEKLIDICNSQITIAMAGSMPLSGIERSGQQLGGGDNQLFLARENYILNNIVPVQNLICKAFNKITKQLGLGEVTINNVPLRITLPTQQPEDMTRSERREILFGLDPLPEDAPEVVAEPTPAEIVAPDAPVESTEEKIIVDTTKAAE